MHRFRLWAPNAKKIRVQLDGVPYPLHPGDGGWWYADVAAAHPGMDYAFFLDDQTLALPDPRSLWQPHGVHGPSRLFDPAAFSWTDAAFQPAPLSSAILYELHIGTLTPEGTFDAAQSKLDTLRSLGITHLELMPVNAFPGVQGWGYDGVDLFAVHEPYGGPAALQRFVNACHARSLAVLLDVVYNHLGPDGNYLAQFGPYFTAAHHTPWGDAVNFEGRGSHEVRRFFCDNALMWLRDYHIDGLRLDAVHAYTDRSAINFMEQLAAEVHALQAETGRPCVVIAESDLNDPRFVMPRLVMDCETAGARAPAEPAVGPPGLGYGLDAQWSDDFHHALFSLLTGDRAGYYADFGSFADLAKSLRDVYVYDGRYSRYRDRIHGRPVPDLPASRFLGYAQNHDQVGNRAKGDRLAHMVSTGRAKIAAALVLTAPFVPMLFQGEEWAASSPFQFFTDHNPDLGRLVSEGRKKEFAAFGWDPADVPDPQSPATFQRSKLNWSERTRPPHAAILDWYRKLIALRRATPALTDPSLSHVYVRYSEEGRWLAMERGPLTIAFSLAPQPVSIPIRPGSAIVLASSSAVTAEEGKLILAPDSVAILTST